MLVEVVAYFAAIVRKWRKKVDGTAKHEKKMGVPEREQPGSLGRALLGPSTADNVAHYGGRGCWELVALVGG